MGGGGLKWERKLSNFLSLEKKGLIFEGGGDYLRGGFTEDLLASSYFPVLAFSWKVNVSDYWSFAGVFFFSILKKFYFWYTLTTEQLT